MSSSIGVADPVAIVLKECLRLLILIRKRNRSLQQSGMTALLGGGADIFVSQDDTVQPVFAAMQDDDPILSAFLQLKGDLSVHTVLAQDLLKPFLQVVSTSTIPGYITLQALESIQKFLRLGIIQSFDRDSIQDLVRALVHCRFEGSEQLSDDSVLLNVVIILQIIIDSELLFLLPNHLLYDVLQVLMSLGCNRRRTEVLRKAAQSSMISLTSIMFGNLQNITPQKHIQVYINDEGYAEHRLKENVIGTLVDGGSTEDVSIAHLNKENDSDSQSMGINLLKQYLSLLASLVIPGGNSKNLDSTKIFTFKLLNIAVEVAGENLLKHPPLFNIVADPIFKSILFVIQNVNETAVLEAALELFVTLFMNLGNFLVVQIDLTFSLILDLFADVPSNDKLYHVKSRPPHVKEMLLEQISVLWHRSSLFFTKTFVNFDCNLDRSDICIRLLHTLSKLAFPEPDKIATENIPAICLEGLIVFVNSIFTNLSQKDGTVGAGHTHETLKQRRHKTNFIQCVKLFNSKPKKGIVSLIEEGFIKSDTPEHVAKFLFENNSLVNKRTIGLLLSDPQEQPLLKCFINLFDFHALRVDEAIRILLMKFRLPGESQQIERIVESFATKYVQDQDQKAAEYDTDVQPDTDSVFILSYSIIMLNTDLHNPQIKEHMSFEDYSSNLKGCYNKSDFPQQYLKKIYLSIKEKEIVMPEEHHGTEKWFEDNWNNMISSTTVITEVPDLTKRNLVDQLSLEELIQFDKEVYDQLGKEIVTALFGVYDIASDERVSERVLKAIERSFWIASIFNETELYNGILSGILKIATFLNDEIVSNTMSEDENSNPMALVEVILENTSQHIPVSQRSLALGGSFKSQQCLLAFCKILNENDRSLVTESLWRDIICLLMRLYEDLLLPPDIFTSLQKTLEIGLLPKPQPDFVINRAKINKGLLSTFASYLKGDEEPTENEIKTCTAAVEVVKASNIVEIVLNNGDEVNVRIIRSVLNSISLEVDDDSARYFESEILFLVEMSVGLFMLCGNKSDTGYLILTKIHAILNKREGLDKKILQRLLSYQLLIMSHLDKNQEEWDILIKTELLAKNEVYTKAFFRKTQGKYILKTILVMAQNEDYFKTILDEPSFWSLLKEIVVFPELVPTIFMLVCWAFENMAETIIPHENFVLILELIDEISSAGAVAVGDEKAGRGDVIPISVKSIDLTCAFLKCHMATLPKEHIIALIQALTHQCLNPCIEIRQHAITKLSESLIGEGTLGMYQTVSAAEMMENGLLPLLSMDETVPMVDILPTLSNIYVFYWTKQLITKDVFKKLFEFYSNKSSGMPEMSKELENLQSML